MRISKNAYKRLSILLTVVMVFTMLAPMASAAPVTAVTLAASTTTPAVGGNVTLTATAAGASATTTYAFWTDIQGVWTMVANSAASTYTWNNMPAGTYVAVVYAKDGATTVMSNRVYIKVASSSAVTTTVASGQINATCTTTNIFNPLFDWWYQTPAGAWVSLNGHFTNSSTAVIPTPLAGNYTVVCNATDPEFFWSLSSGDGQWGSSLFAGTTTPPVVAQPVPATVTSATATTGTIINVVGTGFSSTNFTASMVSVTPKTGAAQYTVSSVNIVSPTSANVILADATPISKPSATGVVDYNFTYTPATGTATTVGLAGETTKPTIASLNVVDATHIQVVYSEKVGATATTAANYTFLNETTSTSVALSGAQSTLALGADKKTVTITVGGTDATTANVFSTVGTGGFLPIKYLLYVSGVNDLAGNTILANSNQEFTGVTTPTSAAPTLQTASFDSGTQSLVLTFDLAPTVADITKYSIVNGATTVAMTAANASAVAGVQVTITMTAAQVTAMGTLSATATTQIAAGGVSSGANTNTATQSVVMTSTVRPSIASAAYDETTRTLSATASAALKLSSITDLSKFKVQYSTDGTTFIDLMTGAQFAANMTVATTGTSATAINFTANAAGAALLNAQRATATAYRLGVTDSAFTTVGAVANDTGAAGGADVANTTMTYTKDNTAPTITSAVFTQADSTLTISFSENMLSTCAPLAANTDAGWDNVSIGYTSGGVDTTLNASVKNGAANITTGATYAVGTNKVTVVLNAAGTNAIMAQVANSLWVKVGANNAITDFNGNAITQQKYTMSVTQNVAVTAVAATEHSSKQVYVTTTGGTLQEAAAENASNYTIYVSGNPNAAVAVSSVAMMDSNADGVKETLVIKTTDALKVDGVVAGYYTLAYTGLKNAAGTAITDGTTTFASLGAEDAAAPTIVAAGTKVTSDADSSNTLTQGDQVTLWFNEPVQVPAATSLQAAFGTSATVAAGVDPNILVVTCGASPTLVPGTTALAANGIKDISNVAYGAGDTVGFPATSGVPAFATTNPVNFVDVNGNGIIDTGDKVTVKFDRTLKSQTIDPTKFKLAKTTGGVDDIYYAVNPSGAATNVFSAATVSTDTVTLTLRGPLNDGLNNGGTAYPTMITTNTEKLNMAAASGVADLWGQAAGALGDKVIYKPTTAPKLTGLTFIQSANANKGAMIFTFDSNVYFPTTSNDAFCAALVTGGGTPKLTTANGTFAATSGDAGNIAYYVDSSTVTHYNQIYVILDGAEAIDASTTFTAAAAAVSDLTTGVVTNVLGVKAARNAASYTVTIQ